MRAARVSIMFLVFFPRSPLAFVACLPLHLVIKYWLISCGWYSRSGANWKGKAVCMVCWSNKAVSSCTYACCLPHYQTEMSIGNKAITMVKVKNLPKYRWSADLVWLKHVGFNRPPKWSDLANIMSSCLQFPRLNDQVAIHRCVNWEQPRCRSRVRFSLISLNM